MRRHSVQRAFVVALLLSTLVIGGCGANDASRDVQREEPDLPYRGSIVFDMAHGEIFSATDPSPLGQSSAIRRMRQAGFEVVINKQLITDDTLAEASGLVLAGPMAPLSPEEYDAINSFVLRGGTVLLTIHVPFPVLMVPAHWGLPVGTDIVMSKRPAGAPEEPSIFRADSIADDEITQGVESVLVVSGWPVSTAGDTARLVVSTGEDSWLSASGDRDPAPPADDELTSFGVVGVARVGEGLVIVSGDDAIFANAALAEADNARLLDNIIERMARMSAEI